MAKPTWVTCSPSQGVNVKFQTNPLTGSSTTYTKGGSALIGVGNKLEIFPTGLGDSGVANSETFFVTYNRVFPPEDLEENYLVRKFSMVIG